MESTIDTVIWDADGTLWGWMDYAAPAYEAMCNALAVYAGKSLDETADAMKAFYTSKGTLEDEGLVQGLAEAGFFTHMRNFDMEWAVHIAKIAFSQERDRHFRVYDGIRETLEDVRTKVKRQIIMTDATGTQAARRLKQSGLEHLFDALYSMPVPRVEGIPQRFRQSTSSSLLIPHYFLEEEKPSVDLSALLGVTREQIAERVVIVGDNDKKDMQQARNSGCTGVLAAYGNLDSNKIPRVVRFAPPLAAAKNIALPDDRKPQDNSRIVRANHAREIPSLIFDRRRASSLSL